MSRSATITMTWADGEHVFRLAWGQIVELQEKTGCGPQHLFSRIANGSWMAGDLSETIRLGLIGGGMEPLKALQLTRSYVQERPLLENQAPALAILGAALSGVETEDWPGKAAPGEMTAHDPSPSDGSTSPGSTEPQP
jgi:hypothetical protein